MLLARAIRLLVLLVLLLPLAARGELKVVSSSSSTAMLVREIAGPQVGLTVLAPPDRDLHLLQVRPSMMRALRGADLVTALGADLEQGWLPLAIQQAANPRILPGRPGYFEAAAQVDLLQVGGRADRSLGDVHPVGNPHINMDPLRMAQVGLALAQRLAELDPQHASDYHARAGVFRDRVVGFLANWQEELAGAPGVVSYHLDVLYLLQRFEVPLLGVLEPVPGVPPTASHLKGLTASLTGRQGVILYTTYQSERAPKSLGRLLGWRSERLQLEPPLDADGSAYLEHIERWVRAIAGEGR